MDSYIGKLCSIFAEAGRQGDWNRTLLLGNPATDDLVKIYLKWPAAQLQVQVTPKQAIPFFPDKLLLLSNHRKRRLPLPTLNASEQFVTTRDQAFFKPLFYFGDRAGVLGQVETAEIARFLMTMVFSLITSGEKPSAMVPRTCLQHPNSTLCPVKAKEEYVAFARRLGVSLTQGYLFRPTDQKGRIVDRPLSSAAAKHQFKLHLKKPALMPGRLSTASTQGGPHPGLFGLRIGRPYEACRMVLPRYS